MNLKHLQDTPPWDWPRDAAERFQEILANRQAKESDRLIAAELAGDLTVMNDQLAASLMKIVSAPDEPGKLRATASISLGPVLEQSYFDQFDDPDDVPIDEQMFRTIQDTFQKLFFDNHVPKEVRRRILEASIRASENWHPDAIRSAYATGDAEWMLTAVFAMRYIPGFDDEILGALESSDPEIHVEAVEAAGAQEVAAAWPHVLALVEDPATPKPLLAAAINAVAAIRPAEARDVLEDLAESEDEEIAAVAEEAIDMAEATSSEAEEDEDDEDEEFGKGWVN
jgi:hypothetical protein